MKTCLIIQPGAFGDIMLCAPIAKIYHDNGYEVHWPATSKFMPVLSRFEYVKPVLIDDDFLDADWLRSDVIKCLRYMQTQSFDIVLNLADRGPHPTAERYGENFEQCKYRLAQIPIEYKHTLSWRRYEDKEVSLYNKVVGDLQEYALVHLDSSRGDRAALPNSIKLPIVEVKEVEGYDIFDWYRVMVNAKEIYCVESSIHQFMDGIVNDIASTPKFILSRSTLGNLKRYTYSPYWATDFLI